MNNQDFPATFLEGEALRMEDVIANLDVSDVRYAPLMAVYLSALRLLSPSTPSVAGVTATPATQTEGSIPAQDSTVNVAEEPATPASPNIDYGKLRVSLRGKLATAKTSGMNISDLLSKFGASKYSDVADADLPALEAALAAAEENS